MSILVTGACGFTGSHMVELLVSEGYDVIATDIEGSERGKYYSESNNRLTPVHYEDIYNDLDGVKFINADITDKKSLQNLFEYNDIDTVFHTASLFDYFADWDVLYEVNVQGVENLLEVCSSNNIDHFIHWSTLGVLGDAGFEKPKTEESEYNTHNDYCKSKLEQELLVKEYDENNLLDTTIIRPAPIYGDRHEYGIRHIIYLLNKIRIAPVFKIRPESKRLKFPSVHVEDLTRAALFIKNNKEKTKGETYNVLSDNITQDELIEFLSENLDLRTINIPINIRLYKILSKGVVPIANFVEKSFKKFDGRPPIDAAMTYYLSHNMWFSNEKIKEAGFEFNYLDPKDGFRDYLEWLNDQGEL